MASLIPGFEYDIFISYRQKDNKHDGWVTEFVDNLKGELESTFKEEVSVYFDINPHDGLLETHDVDASLNVKLKCLVFMPIISRTYCDPKSFAWEHEFKAFVERASQDKFGLKVRLPNGNIANRVLPVRIHDLDREDIKLCESVLGGVLRGVEFIYKEPGVNRSLTPDDEDRKNLNNTRYRNQINKVALAIKEIILGLKAESEAPSTEKIEQKPAFGEVKQGKTKKIYRKPFIQKWMKRLPGILIAAVLIIAFIIAYNIIFKKETLEELRSSDKRISVAVMPFQNLTSDTTWNNWQNGIQANLISSFTNPEIIVRQTETVNSILHSKGLTNYASLTPSAASIISQKLDANVFIYGNISKAGATIRLNAQLVDSKTKEVFKSFKIDGTSEKILVMIDSLSVMIKNSLIISKLEKQYSSGYGNITLINSPEAYRYYLQGARASNKTDFPTARYYYLKALEIDSNLVAAIMNIAITYLNEYNESLYKEGKAWCLRWYKKQDLITDMSAKIWGNCIYAYYFETPNDRIRYLRQLKDIDDQNPNVYFNTGDAYFELFQYDKAIAEFEKGLEILHKWDVKPWLGWCAELGNAYHYAGEYRKEGKLYKKTKKDFPDNPEMIDQYAWLSLTEGDTVTAGRYIKQWISLRKEQSLPEAQIDYGLVHIYKMAGMPDKVEEYDRHALSLNPEDPGRIAILALFLIDNKGNIDEGLELANKALELKPDNYNALHAKGWGLYKQGKYKEALEMLQKSWDLRRENSIYNHLAYLHLEEAKKAVASQK